MIQARFIVESQGKPKSFVENSLKKHIEKLKTLKGANLYDIKFEPTEEIDGIFSSLADVGVKAENFEIFFTLLMGLAPTAVIVEKPAKIEVELREIQNITNDTIQMFHAFAQANHSLRMKLQTIPKHKHP